MKMSGYTEPGGDTTYDYCPDDTDPDKFNVVAEFKGQPGNITFTLSGLVPAKRKSILRTLRERLPDTVLIIDAGIGAPSHAAQALEMGFDAVLLNSAVSQAQDPVCMAGAFRQAIEAGRSAFLAGVMAKQDFAVASTPVGGQPFLVK